MKKILFFVLISSVLLAGCGQQSAGDKANEITGSIEDLLSQNKTLKCELVASQDGATMSGITYVSGDMARSDSTVKFGEGQTMTSHMINDGTWIYTWSDEYPAQAVKMKLDTLEDEDFTAEADEEQEFGLKNYQSQMDYKCYDWNKDQSMFTPPADINFTDYSQLMEQMQQGIEGLQSGGEAGDMSAMCGSCDMMPDADSIETCKQQLGCN